MYHDILESEGLNECLGAIFHPVRRAFDMFPSLEAGTIWPIEDEDNSKGE